MSAPIEDFEYSPKPGNCVHEQILIFIGEYDGPFSISNQPNELELLKRFFEHIRQLRPGVVVTYNGDFFDWPFVETRAQFYGLDMKHVILEAI